LTMAPSLFSFWRDALDFHVGLQHRLEFWRPVSGAPAWLAPAVAIGGLLGLVAAIGFAVASVAMLLTALLVAHLILTEVFGVALAVDPSASARRAR
jgi:hypothetical protein